jgi:hypothetical protein
MFVSMAQFLALVQITFMVKLYLLCVTVLLCWVTPDFELYATFDPLADKV